ncbi:MAG: putative ral secretion pathway protein [Verrucomicrobiota bacterium]
MKTILSTLIAVGVAGLLLPAAAQPAPDNGNNPAPAAEQPASPPSAEAGNAAPAADAAGVTPPDFSALPPPPPEVLQAIAAQEQGGTTDNSSKPSVTIQPTRPLGAESPKVQSAFTPPEAKGTNANELRMNFKNAPLEMVLNYLSDAAGFIIVLDTQVRGSVSVISSQPVTKDEAVDLLNSVLNKNGYAAIRDGRTLTIVDKNDAKTRDIPVKSGNNPADIPKNAEIVTQIIPIRFVEARQLVSDLSLFVSPQATVVANEAGNSIVITDTQSNIRHLAEIIRAIDNSAEAETEIRVFRLQYANPSDVATELTSIFPSSSSGGTQSPTRFGGSGGGGGGPGGFFQRMMGGGGGNTGSSSNDRIKKATQVSAVADSRIQAVIVTAPKDLMEEIAGMMKDLDVASTRDQKVFVVHMDNADPQQAAQVLQNMFQGNNSRTTTGSSQNSALQQRVINNATTSSSSSSSSGFGTSSSSRTGGGR